MSLRTLLSFTLSFAFLLAQMPAPAQCQMGISALTMRCSMPCCQKLPKNASCPMMQKAAPRDAMAPASATEIAPTFDFVKLMPTSIPMGGALKRLRQIAKTAPLLCSFFKSPPVGRAPPSDILLLQA